MSSPPIKARTLDEIINGLPVEDQARVVARVSELVTEVLQAQDSRQTTHDEENPTVSQPLAPIDRIIVSNSGCHSEPGGTEIELRPVTVLLGDNNSGKSAFLSPLETLCYCLERARNGGRAYKQLQIGSPVGTQILDLRCDGKWTKIAVDKFELGSERVRVIEGGVSETPGSYIPIRLPAPLCTSVESIMDGQTYLEDLRKTLECWSVTGDARLLAVSEDVRTLGLGQGIKLQSIPVWESESLHLFVTSNAGESYQLHQVGSGTRDAIQILVALRKAAAGQLVHLVNPEAGLHPRVMIALTGLLVEAARRGVRLLVETHSTTILRALQLAVAEDDSGWVRDNLALYWFALDEQGVSRFTQAEVQADGSYGDWPCDLTLTELDLTRRLLDASYRRRAAQQQPSDKT